jgi:hypothetical protein
MFTTKSEVVGRPSVVSDDLLQIVDQKICEIRRFTKSEHSCEFPEISRTLIYDTVIIMLGYHKFWARWVPKLLTGAHKKQRTASALTFLQRYHEDGDEFLNYIVRVIVMKPGFHLWMMKPKSSRSSGCTHIHQTSRKSSNKLCLPVVTIISHAYYKTLRKKNCLGPFRKRAWNANILCSASPWQCASVNRCSHSSTAGAFQLGVVCPHFIQPWSHSERLPPVYYLKNWLGSQSFNNNRELMEGVKTWLS